MLLCPLSISSGRGIFQYVSLVLNVRLEKKVTMSAQENRIFVLFCQSKNPFHVFLHKRKTSITATFDYFNPEKVAPAFEHRKLSIIPEL